MKKYSFFMFTTVLFVVGILLHSCNKEDATLSDTDFFRKNISIFDARVRSIDEYNYVRELYLVNFSDEEWGTNVIVFQDLIFRDNGENNDLIANDGIFTSEKTIKHDGNKNIPTRTPLRSVLENPIVSYDFIRQNELEQLNDNYSLENFDGGTTKGRIIIDCTINFYPNPEDECHPFGHCINIGFCDIIILW